MAEEKPEKTPKPPKAQKVFDVAKPTETPAPATSRPVIVGHTNSMQKDPMVAPVVPAIVDTQPETNAVFDKPKSEKTLQPVSPETIASPKAEKTVEEPQAEEEKSAPETTEASPNVSDNTQSAGAVDAIVSGLNTKKERLKQEEEETKHQEEVRSLISSKKYYVKTHMPPSKRKFRGLVTLLFIIILGAAGWYFGVGPGKELWDQSQKITTDASSVAATTQASSPQPTTTETPKTIEKATFSDTTLGISFEYPKAWTVEKTKDSEFPTRDVITIKSQTETIKTAAKGAQPVDAEVFLRTTIIVENTKNAKEYASDLVSLSACTSEDVVVAGATLELLYLDPGKEGPNISQVSLSPSNCVASGSLFTANDQIQLPAKKNTYIMFTEYVFSDAYLKKVGTSTPEAIATAQNSGVVTTKDSFKSGTQYQSLLDAIKSLKEL